MSKLYANAFSYTFQAFFIAGFFFVGLFFMCFYLKYSDLKLGWEEFWSNFNAMVGNQLSLHMNSTTASLC